jgi:polyisoprenoid-binding protein YceI
MKSRFCIAALLATSAGIGSAAAAEWQLAEGQGSVEFTAVQQGTKFTGRFRTFSAVVDIDPDDVEGGHITGTVETASVNTRDHDRDASLLDRDWFDSSTHPEAWFESQTITRLDDGSYRAAGELTLKGTTRPMNLDFTFDASGETAEFSGDMTIDRFDFNVGEGWSDTSWVGQNVEVRVNLALMR